ncbi:2-hydroxyacid dehydrogenase [Celeribacter arenosi]|uniref:2-hydroxyacid dehydrogenase n=1 Tax=Celeribacter arenosi TaxID=792649 RepID=A0ABP7JWW5_9RHOB
MSNPELVVVAPDLSDRERAGFEAITPFVHLNSQEDAVNLSAQARAAVTAMAVKFHGAVGGDQMDRFENLKTIANFGVGYDQIDVAAATARGITVTNTPDVLNDDVADLTLAMMLAVARTIVDGDAWVRSGRWATGEAMPLNRKMSGASVGIVGLGRIGQVIANRLGAFDMDIHYHSRSPKDVPYTYHADVVDLARSVDWLVIALVGGKETEGYISREVIDALGAEGVVINISRGSTVDEGALLDALEQGRIAGAGLDVFLNEPRIDPRFLALNQVVLQPHQGSATVQTRVAMGDLQRDNIAAHFAQRPLLSPVN